MGLYPLCIASVLNKKESHVALSSTPRKTRIGYRVTFYPKFIANLSEQRMVIPGGRVQLGGGIGPRRVNSQAGLFAS
jgi:hypothetical protein